MANNKSIKILRGTNAKVYEHRNDVLEYGQLLYNADKNYITIGGASGTTKMNAQPIYVRRLQGIFSDGTTISGDTYSDANGYYIKGDSSTDGLVIYSSKGIKLNGQTTFNTNPIITSTIAANSNTNIAATTAWVRTASGNTTLNAATTTTLQTSRTIDGVIFNGSANIIHYGTCSTAAATAAKVATITGFSLSSGAKVVIKFSNANTASSPTLNINSTGAKSIYRNRVALTSTASWLAGAFVEFVYDGTQFNVVADSSRATRANRLNNDSLVGSTTQPIYFTADGVPAAITGNIANSTTGNAATATKLATGRTIRTQLASTTAPSFDGSSNITPGVTGILPVSNGGTGQTSLSSVTVGQSDKIKIGSTYYTLSFSNNILTFSS